MQALLNTMPGALAEGFIWGIMAIGVYITFKILDLADLTVDGTMAIGGITLVVSVANGINIYIAMLIAFIAGCLSGLITGILHTKFGIPAILAGILTQLALYSLFLRVSQLYPTEDASAINTAAANVTISARKYNVLVSVGEKTQSIIVGLLFCVVIIALLYWFFGTERGHSIRATGCNPAMSSANGININANKIIGLVLSNGLVAISGALLAQFKGSADVNMGRGAIVIGLASVIIGEVIFGKLFKNFALRLLAAVFGSVIYYIVLQIVLWLGLDTNDLKLFAAVVVALFLGVPYWKAQIAGKKTRILKFDTDGGAENA